MGSGGQFLAYGMVGVLGQSGGARKKRAVKMDLGIRWSERGRFRLDKWQFMVFDEILQQISTYCLGVGNAQDAKKRGPVIFCFFLRLKNH